MKKVIALAGILAFLYACGPSTDKDKDETPGKTTEEIEDPITNIKVMQLEYTDFTHELVSNGTVSTRKKADLHFSSSENVVSIFVKNSDRVSKGQKLAMLDQFTLENSLEQAKISLEQAKLELQDVLIGQEYSLNDSANIPESVMKIARLRSGYDNSLNQHRSAEYNYKNSVLYAPFSGVVANLLTKEYNPANSNDPFCTIVDNTNPEVVFMILESEIPLVHIGDKVMISAFALVDYKTEGRVTEINPVVNKNGMVRVTAVAQNAGNKLYDGMNVKVLIQRQASKQLVIPKEALVLRTNHKVVFTLKNDRAYWNYVETGLENSQGYVVTEGLNAGDSVIYEGNINLAHESRVNILKR